jgi:hypothetical protein
MQGTEIIGFMTANRANLIEARSALPDAPVVPHRERTVGTVRRKLAGTLHRFADTVAPPRPAGAAARRVPLPAGSETH